MAVQYSRRPPSSSFDSDSHDMNRAPGNYREREPASDDDDAASDMSEDLVEIPSEDIPDYFQERGGRLFHSHGASPYPLPVDAEEQQVSRARNALLRLPPLSGRAALAAADAGMLQRQNGLNALLRRLIGDFSVGPVGEVLADALGEQRRVLDLGTGTGQWYVMHRGRERALFFIDCRINRVLDMARDFPRARFYGVDIVLSDRPPPVPIATRYPPHNVQFEMHDIKEAFRFDSASIDFVHARMISMAIRDYGALLPEIARVLRRGGLFVSSEWGRRPIMVDGSDLAVRAPHTSEFFTAVRETLRERRGIHTVAPGIPRLLDDSGCFVNIVPRRYYMPIGDWHTDPELRELGREYREMVELYARSMRAVLIEGRWAADADALIEGYIQETWRVRGMVSVYYTVHARRV
ncbi:S-adenosyl-L-methionine-dependent methyltransferase [Dichomitus squalens]|uniref:S-adenosyl-L-methionine-dependent methyltransferase n=1 Tax=Dichomitus squalens TaxID=114155 RepID=A0A4V2JZF9_9APHY|nr:S-adenosyl-L-methionine-dependent methyltransferase [Dichomitus squalens]